MSPASFGPASQIVRLAWPALVAWGHVIGLLWVRSLRFEEMTWVAYAYGIGGPFLSFLFVVGCALRLVYVLLTDGPGWVRTVSGILLLSGTFVLPTMY